jgi:hypothetical protein
VRYTVIAVSEDICHGYICDRARAFEHLAEEIKCALVHQLCLCRLPAIEVVNLDVTAAEFIVGLENGLFSSADPTTGIERRAAMTSAQRLKRIFNIDIRMVG